MPSDWMTTARFALGAAATLVYLTVGIVVGLRRTSKEAVLGLRAFQLFWFGLAVLTLLGPLLYVLDALAIGGLASRVFLLQAAIILIVLAIGGLLYYLGYVYSGRKWLIWPVGVYTFLEIAFLVTAIGQARVVAYGDDCPGRFCFETPLQSTPMSLVLSLSIFIPILVGVVGYFALYFRVTERVARRRILMVATSLGLWFGSGLAASLVRGTYQTNSGLVETSLNQSRLWADVLGPAIGLAAALVILWAYLMRRQGMPNEAEDASEPPKLAPKAPVEGRRLSWYPALT